eukprot:TRINITY_DN52890_c0_g1_i1.p2 TRINITY_DN52890_c0_g1~~TRINITY_DN52890_c0_g1_i1.p2  ORF type:complete len:107 (-),score=12.37 TRINITY_DN52890_c0_g1_i1:51-371(-)
MQAPLLLLRLVLPGGDVGVDAAALGVSHNISVDEVDKDLLEVGLRDAVGVNERGLLARFNDAEHVGESSGFLGDAQLDVDRVRLDHHGAGELLLEEVDDILLVAGL